MKGDAGFAHGNTVPRTLLDPNGTEITRETVLAWSARALDGASARVNFLSVRQKLNRSAAMGFTDLPAGLRNRLAGIGMRGFPSENGGIKIFVWHEPDTRDGAR